MSDHLLYEASEEIEERYQLVLERIQEITQEKILPDAYADFFHQVSNYVLLVDQAYMQHEHMSLEELQQLQEQLYAPMKPFGYDESYLNPAYASDKLGDELGGLLSLLYSDMMAMIPYAYEGRLDLLTIFMELFVQVYGCFTEEVADTDSDIGEVTEEASTKAVDWAAVIKYVKNNVNEAIYWFYHDYSEIFAAESVITMVDSRFNFFTDIVMKADLTEKDYLYQYGSYIGENELGLWRFLQTLSEDQIQKMADTFTEGYRIGFEITGKDITKKKTVKIEYPIGFERVIRKAIENFDKLNLKPTIVREAILSFQGRGNSKRGCYTTSLNKQFDYDHKDDRAYYFDKGFVERRLEVLRDTFEKNAKAAGEHGGPAVIEVFGEVPFAPENKTQRKTYDGRQNELNVYFASESGKLTNQYIKGEERSFTIIAFPVPAIGEQFEEIFAKTVEINTLDYMKYRDMQQCIIDVLDQGVSAHIVGAGDNHTNLTVALHPLQDPAKETIFENCVADVNIPVGEVFTSPVLTGTNGVLHVTQVFLNELMYKDIEVTFTDGMITDYTCKNFATEEENRKYIKDNVLYHHETLPMGEFAIGTNTTAYRMARDYNIADKLPILIAEKTGPHFAVGDTCYSYAEDTPMYNPDGKEVVARDNACSLLRKTDPSKAYFNCHTDITIPYDELDSIRVLTQDGRELSIIEEGRFVVKGTEELNQPLT